MHRRLAQNVLLAPRLSTFRGTIVRRSSTTVKATTFNPALVVAASIISGGLGYFLARSQPESRNRIQATSKSRYGSPEDFKKAIGELQSVFGEDAVSTDPEVVGPYGYSENDYHPGEFEFSITKSRAILTLCTSYISQCGGSSAIDGRCIENC